MSLVRLLTAGKSLVGLNDGEGRYRLTRKNLLPSFPASKNPFRATAVPSPACIPEPAPVTQDSGAGAEEPGKVAPQEQPGDAPPKARQSALKRIRDLWFRGSRSPRLDNRPLEPRQTELSLDQVKVVRNDLSEYDRESAATAPAATAKPPTDRARSKPSPRSEPELGASFLAEKKL
jgi:hypothetical protein